METPTSTPPSFAHQAAKASWASAVILILLLAFGRRVAPPVILEMIALVLILVGFTSGILALFGIRKHGAKGILAPALAGIMINGLLLFIFFSNFFAAIARARTRAMGTTPPAAVAASRIG
jgi:hypothetical protein